MAVRIRLRRMGRKKQAHYRIVVADGPKPRDGRIIEKLGYYKPLSEPARLILDVERAEHWISQGALASDTVHSLIKKARKGGDEKIAIGEVDPEEEREKRAAERQAEAAAAAEAGEEEPEDEGEDDAEEEPEAEAAEEPDAEEEEAPVAESDEPAGKEEADDEEEAEESESEADEEEDEDGEEDEEDQEEEEEEKSD